MAGIEYYDWDSEDYGPKVLEGTEDWENVIEYQSSSGYSWAEFRAYYSPSARKFFWKSRQGCSCNSWVTGIKSASDMCVGDSHQLLAEIKSLIDPIKITNEEEEEDDEFYLSGLNNYVGYAFEDAQKIAGKVREFMRDLRSRDPDNTYL